MHNSPRCAGTPIKLNKARLLYARAVTQAAWPTTCLAYDCLFRKGDDECRDHSSAQMIRRQYMYRASCAWAQKYLWDHVRPEYAVDAEHESGGRPEGETIPRIAMAHILPLRASMSPHSIILYLAISMM